MCIVVFFLGYDSRFWITKIYPENTDKDDQERHQKGSLLRRNHCQTDFIHRTGNFWGESASIQGERETSAILLTVVVDGWKNQKPIYNMGSKLDSFLRKRCFLFCFVHDVVLLISLEIMRKIYIGLFILRVPVRNIISKIMLHVRCSLSKIKQHFMLIFWSESRGNTIKKSKGSLWLRKLKVDVLTVHRRALRLSMLPVVRSFKLK